MHESPQNEAHTHMHERTSSGWSSSFGSSLDLLMMVRLCFSLLIESTSHVGCSLSYLRAYVCVFMFMCVCVCVFRGGELSVNGTEW